MRFHIVVVVIIGILYQRQELLFSPRRILR